jgi:thymidylate synthase (FAD)
MKIVKASFVIEEDLDGYEIIKKIEKSGRVCYKSEDRIDSESAQKFIRMIIKNGHESVLEHEKISVRIICDRGVSHELVRHRIASYSQESTRYCNYSQNKFGNEITVIEPCFWSNSTDEAKQRYLIWEECMKQIEEQYMKLIQLGAEPQQARSILPNSLKTEIIMTMNLREWRHFFKLRTSTKAHPQMREIAQPLLQEFKKIIPEVFDDIN